MSNDIASVVAEMRAEMEVNRSGFGLFPKLRDWADRLLADIEYEFEIWHGDELLAGGVAATSHECGAESAHYAMMYGQDGPVTVRFYERREITETSHDPQ